MTGTLLNPACNDSCFQCPEDSCIENDSWLLSATAITVTLDSLLDWAPFLGSNQSEYLALLGSYNLALNEAASQDGDRLFTFDGSTASPLVLYNMSLYREGATGKVTFDIGYYNVSLLNVTILQTLTSFCFDGTPSSAIPNGALTALGTDFNYPFGSFRPMFATFSIEGRRYQFASQPFISAPYPTSAYWAYLDG